jgi:hypothetical protein
MVSRLIAALLVTALPVSAALAFSPELDPSVAAGAAAEPAIPPLAPSVPGAAGPTSDEPEVPDEAGESAEPENAPAPTLVPNAPSAAPDTPEVGTEEDGPDLPRILRSDSEMPDPVREMRAKLIEAAKSGDIEKLRKLMSAQAQAPSVSFGDPGDPIEYLKALSSDADGREILAILLEVLESGFVHVGAGTADELYVWPYFAQYPIEALTPQQLVELFTLLTAADYEDMKSYGSYTFFRVGIAPDGRWLFFLAGD